MDTDIGAVCQSQRPCHALPRAPPAVRSCTCPQRHLLVQRRPVGQTGLLRFSRSCIPSDGRARPSSGGNSRKLSARGAAAGGRSSSSHHSMGSGGARAYTALHTPGPRMGRQQGALKGSKPPGRARSCGQALRAAGAGSAWHTIPVGNGAARQRGSSQTCSLARHAAPSLQLAQRRV